MPREAPDWWQQTHGPWPALLQPLATLYGWTVALRFARGRPVTASVPVICIGNLTVGGAGKTPLALATARHLLAGGQNPVFLSRGYGGRIKGPHRVRLGEDGPQEVGDEPRLLARLAPTIIARDRVAGAEAAARAGASVIIMDDGFQNPALAKDLSIIVVDGETGVGNGRVLPAGPLRAPLDHQLERADALVILGRGDAARDLAKTMQGRRRPVLRAALVPLGDTRWLHAAPVIAFAGIGRPEKFFATLARLGIDIERRRPYPDHHVFTEADARQLLGETKHLQAQLVTTEKDWERMAAEDGSGVAALKRLARPLPVVLEWDHAASFGALIDAVLSGSDQA